MTQQKSKAYLYFRACREIAKTEPLAAELLRLYVAEFDKDSDEGKRSRYEAMCSLALGASIKAGTHDPNYLKYLTDEERELFPGDAN